MKKKICVCAYLLMIALSLKGYLAFVHKEEIFILDENPKGVSTFEECMNKGNPVMESYPRKCRHKENFYTEEIGNTLEKHNLIRLNSVFPNQEITSPLSIEGEARGTWFFEGSFPIFLTNWDGLIIAEGFVEAEGEWMTEEFVPFKGELTFTAKEVYPRGTLILQKNNASDLPEHDDALEIPIQFLEK